MTSRFAGMRVCVTALAAWLLAVLIASWSVAPAVSVRAAAQDLGTDAQRESGKQLYLKFCAQCHGDKGDGEGYATPHLNPKPRELHHRQVQDPHHTDGRAPDASGSREHHPPRDAVHVDAGVAEPLRPGGVGPRALPDDVFAGLRETGERPQGRRAPERARRDGRIDRPREEALRGNRLREMSRHARPGRRTFGSDAEGRLG